MIRATARRVGGIVGSLTAGVALVVTLVMLAPPAVQPADQADAAGRPIWLLLGGGCGLPVALFYGWVAGAWVAGLLAGRRVR